MTESFTIMQEIMRSRATHNLHYGVRPRHVYFVKVQQGKNAYYGSKRTSGKNVPECKTHREKSSVTYGKYRKNSVALSFLASELVVVENNSLSDLTEAASQGKTPQQVAKERVEAENERYKKENCAGMSAEACSVKMYTQRQAELKDIL